MALAVNREAWNILYVIVHYHVGTMDYLNKSNTIHLFLELVATFSNNIVITNGMHTITKVHKYKYSSYRDRVLFVNLLCTKATLFHYSYSNDFRSFSPC
jgi:hypothetical protein